MKHRLPLLALALLLLPACVFAWGGETHRKITSDAYYILPEGFRQFLGAGSGANPTQPHLKALLDASVEPDTTLKDFRNHVYHIHGFDMGNGPFHIEKLVHEIVADIKAKAPMAKIIQKLGWVCHYVADITQPLHTGVATWEGIEEKSFHAGFEKDVTKNVYSLPVWFDGTASVERLSARMIYEALWANQYYDAIEAAYVKGQRYDDVKKVASLTYSRAVNNVVDIWYTIWAMSGGKIDPTKDSKPKFFPAFTPAKALRMLIQGN